MLLPTTEPVRREWLIHTVSLEAPHQEFSYHYYLRSGPEARQELVEKLGALSPEPDRFAIIIDGSFPLDLAQSVQDLISIVAPCTLHVFHGGEQSKDLVTVYELGNEALDAGLTRRSVIVALGGGLAGNVGGLLATLLMRGIRLVHIPTTLLAMSDSCLSLKQGVNSLVGKNHFGAFYAPVLVWSDLAFLAHLPARETRAALCELIKNVLAICPERFDEIASLLRADAVYTQEQIAHFIGFCIEAKGRVMQGDALEKHGAVALEYGHSVGHALELLAHGELPHGLAIGIGMVVEANISRRLGWMTEEDVLAHLTLLQKNGAPIAIPLQFHPEDILALLEKDNKRGYLPPRPGAVDMVLLETLGKPHQTGQTVITQVDRSVVRAALEWSRTHAPSSVAPKHSVVSVPAN